MMMKDVLHHGLKGLCLLRAALLWLSQPFKDYLAYQRNLFHNLQTILLYREDVYAT